MKFTVLGGQGYIGSHLVTYLRQQGHECFCPTKDDDSIFFKHLGHVIYCIGLTADFRYRPYDTVRAHVSVLADVLEKSNYESLLYLSSTRIYGNSEGADEGTSLSVDPQNMSDLYNLTKMTGESLCFAAGSPTVRVARLSNVYGGDFKSENFLASLIRDAVGEGRLLIRTSPESAKDYIYIGDVLKIILLIATSGKERLYNVASGRNVSNQMIKEYLQAIVGCDIEYVDGAPLMDFPLISIERLRREFDFLPEVFESMLEKAVCDYQQHILSKGM